MWGYQNCSILEALEYFYEVKLLVFFVEFVNEVMVVLNPISEQLYD